jgi:hypothetical protein
VNLARGLSGTGRIFPFMSSSRSRLPVLLPSIKRGCRKSYGVRQRGRLRHGFRGACGTGSAGQVRAEAQPMAGQESTASQTQGGGSREAHASVSLGSAGAGEEKLRTYLKEVLGCQKNRVRVV